MCEGSSLVRLCDPAFAQDYESMMSAEIIDFTKYLAAKQREETKAWLQRQGVMPIPCTLPEDFFDDDELKPSDV